MMSLFDTGDKQRQAIASRAMSMANLPRGRVQVAGAGTAGGMLGKGAMSGLGYKTAEEHKVAKVMEIMDKYPNPESMEDKLKVATELEAHGIFDVAEQIRTSVLEEKKGKAYAQQVELQSKALEIKQKEQAAQERVPKLGNWWDINKKQGAISYWLKVNHDEEALKDVDWATMTEAKAKALLRKIHKGGAGAQIKTMEASLAQARNTHIINNKFNPDAPTSAPATKDGTFLFNGEAAGDKPNLGGTQIPVTPAPAWQQGKGFWDDVNRQDTGTALPSDEIY
jgi:hypothetical protein